MASGGIQPRRTTGANVTTPDSSHVALFIGDGTGGTVDKALYAKDSAGVVTLLTYGDEAAQDAVGNILLDSTTIDFTYDDATPNITAVLAARYKNTIDNLWIDVTANATANIVATAGAYNATNGAANVTAWNAIYAAAPVGATFYFPPQTSGAYYDFNAELACNRDIRMRVLGAGEGRSILRAGTSTTAHLFNQSVAGFYIDFINLGFTTAVTKTAGAAITATSNNAYFNVIGCEFTAQFRSIDLSSTAGNVGLIQNCWFNSPVANGSQIKINGGGINIMLHNVNINCGSVAGTAGVEINASGAIQITGCDIIGGVNALLVNATSTVSAIYCTNTFFDQATGSCVKFMGASSISRVKFMQCGITNTAGGTNAALEIAGSGTGINIPEALDFELCDFYNSGAVGGTGLLITGCRGFDLRDCRVAGFTVGIDITPYNSNGITNFNIDGCTIGPTENFNANATGIRINAGAPLTCGPSSITNNDLSGNTTAALTDNGTYTNGYLYVANNFGLAMPRKAEVPNTLIPLTTPVTRGGSGWGFAANELRVGTHLRITVGLTCAATAQTLTPTLKMGTANSNADADLIGTGGINAGTAALGSMTIVYDVHIISATTVIATAIFNNAGVVGVTNNVGPQTKGSAGPITIASIATTAFFIAPYFISATASAVTVRSVAYEVVAQ